MNKKSQLGQFYTTNAEYIIGNLINDIPQKLITIVDPFAGECDLLNLLLQKRQYKTNYLSFDIDPKNKKTIKRDSLLCPCDYTDKWVVTNPPYLACNKTKDKTIFNKWQTKDLYKASIKSIIGCNGGILIVPLNFFCDERDCETRVSFLSQYNILNLNIFEESVFNDTDYTICAFSFVKKESNSTNDKIKLCPKFFPHVNKCFKTFILEKKYNYRIGGKEIFEKLITNQSSVKISRLVEKDRGHIHYISNIFLRCIDTGTISGKIKLEKNNNHYYGKISDRAFATIVFSIKLTKEQENVIISTFNKMLNEDRKKFYSLFLTNYRNSTKNYSRKRISFDLAFTYISYILKTELGIN